MHRWKKKASTFKARIKAVERPAGAEWKPFSQVTDEMIEQNFSQIEHDITSLMQALNDSATPTPTTPPAPQPSSNGQALADDF